jgi:hypothetical protein
MWGEGSVRKPALAAIGLTFSFGLVGCEATHLFVAHQTVVGVDAAVDTQMMKGHLVIGYDRNFVAIIPKSVDASSPTAGVAHRDAMSAIACHKVEVKGIALTQFTEYLATGEAGKIYAESLRRRTGRQLFNCVDAESAATKAGN